jgi:hypothetical protein
MGPVSVRFGMGPICMDVMDWPANETMLSPALDRVGPGREELEPGSRHGVT